MWIQKIGWDMVHFGAKITDIHLESHQGKSRTWSMKQAADFLVTSRGTSQSEIHLYWKGSRWWKWWVLCMGGQGKGLSCSGEPASPPQLEQDSFNPDWAKKLAEGGKRFKLPSPPDLGWEPSLLRRKHGHWALGCLVATWELSMCSWHVTRLLLSAFCKQSEDPGVSQGGY